jgi:hypothetical protein
MVVVVGQMTDAVPVAYVDDMAQLPPEDVTVAFPTGSIMRAPSVPLMVVDPALMVKVLLAAPRKIVPVAESAPKDNPVAPTMDVVNPRSWVVFPMTFPMVRVPMFVSVAMIALWYALRAIDVPVVTENPDPGVIVHDPVVYNTLLAPVKQR